MASAFSDSLMTSGGGGWSHLEISGTAKGMTQMLVSIKRHEVEKLTYLSWFVNYRPKFRKSWYLKMELLGMLTSTGLSILASQINPENFRSISQRVAILQNNL